MHSQNVDSNLGERPAAGRTLLATRESLLSRLRHREDDGWHEFFETYWKLIYNTAIKSGLNDDEAQEVVQETMIGVSRRIPEYQYEPKLCSFKSWLMNLIYWRIVDQRRRRRDHAPLESAIEVALEESFLQTWEEDWERNLIDAALDRVRHRVDPGYFQIFSLCVLQRKGVAETARLLNVMRPRVHLAIHRISRILAKEIAVLRQAKGIPI
jgi:RNA polymerase sigma factor (sigma-70 family)